MNRLVTSFAVLATALAAGCSLAPDDHRPDLPTPAAYKEAGDWKPAAPADATLPQTWWTLFGDSALDRLQGQVAAANQNVKAAAARLEQARAVARAAGADAYPQVGGAAASTRFQRSATTQPVIKPAYASDHLADVAAAWEVDLWGRVRNTIAGAEARAAASGDDLAAIELGQRAELAVDYFILRGLDARIAILDRTVTAYQEALALTQRRHDGGLAVAADVAQAETQVETARTQAAEARLRRAQVEHAIAILIGQPPAQFSLPMAPLVASPPPMAPSLPSELLQQRPDVAAAERRVEAANADIGVARAAWFPAFDLRAVAGAESGAAATWMQAASGIWSVGPTLALTVFDGGRIAAGVDRARASHGEAVASYRQTVLAAWRDVEDQLAALSWLEREAATQDAAVTAANTALEQARQRYRGGLVTYLEVVSTENTALTAQLNAADIRSRRMVATVQLVQVLGGGWTGAASIAEAGQP